jgi:hypothetical protein
MIPVPFVFLWFTFIETQSGCMHTRRGESLSIRHLAEALSKKLKVLRTKD